MISRKRPATLYIHITQNTIYNNTHTKTIYNNTHTKKINTNHKNLLEKHSTQKKNLHHFNPKFNHINQIQSHHSKHVYQNSHLMRIHYSRIHYSCSLTKTMQRKQDDLGRYLITFYYLTITLHHL